jgi:dipeptidyl aminopeptidase/acylaminoacyl peptidase
VVWGRNIRGEGVIERIDVETGRETFIARARDIQQVQVAPDGLKIYYQDGFYSGGAQPKRVVEHELATGAERDIQPADVATRASVEPRPGVQIRADRKTKTSTVTFPAGDGDESRTVTVPAVLDGGRGVFATPSGQAVLAASSDDRARMLWLIPVNGAPRKLEIDTRSWSGSDFRLSPDGKHIAYFSGHDAREVWALENVVPISKKR